MKKRLSTLLVIIALFSLVGCVNRWRPISSDSGFSSSSIESSSDSSAMFSSESTESESSIVSSEESSSSESSVASESSESIEQPSESSEESQESSSQSSESSEESSVSSEDTSVVSSSSEQSSESTSSTPEEVYYKVTFLDEDETKLAEIDVLEGEDAIYPNEDPTKEEDDEFTYKFIGWDKELTNVTEDIVTKAVYEAVSKENWGPIIWF